MHCSTREAVAIHTVLTQCACADSASAASIPRRLVTYARIPVLLHDSHVPRLLA